MSQYLSGPKSLFLFLFFFAVSGVSSQTVLFSEDFGMVGDPEYNGATTGTSAEGYTWNSNCPDCIPTGDIFETLNGQLRGNDTNGPAFFTSTGIDATGCFVLTFQFDYNAAFGYAGSGNLECADECPFNGPPFCSGNVDDAVTTSECNNCWDFLAWEINSGSVSDEAVVLGLDCNAGPTGSVESDPLCLDQVGADPSNVNLTITMAMWATNEWMEIDNITILCYTEAEANSNGLNIPAGCGGGTCNITIDDVIVTDPDCDNVDNGEIEIDATGVNLSGFLEYSIDNGSSFQSSNTFSGLGVGTYDIIVQDDSDPSCFATTTVIITAPPAPIAIAPPPLVICYSLIPLAGEILNLDEILDEIRNFDPSLTVNWYFDMAATNPLDPTDPGDIITLITNFQTTVYATVVEGNCESNAVPVSVSLNTYPSASDGTLMECLGSNGLATFTPSDADNQVTGGDPSLMASYHSTLNDAENGNNPITGIVTTPTDLTLFVRIENAAGCATTSELELIVTSGATPSDASLEACDDGSGQATFDLTSLESPILNGASGTVLFFEDMATNNPIGNPGNYTSSTTTVYAVIDDGMGCLSTPAEVDLSVLTIDPADVFLTFDPASGCGETSVAMTLNTPSDPAGAYTFNVSYGPVSVGPVSNGNFTGMDGETPFLIGINEDYIFVLNSVTGPGPFFCEVIFSPGVEYIIPIDDAPTAFPADITACANALGEGTFDLTLLESTINDNTGFPVDFYEDFGLTSPINNPSSYVSGEGTVFAVVDAGGGCLSEPVAITLFLEEAPDPVDFTLDITNSCTATDVTLTFSLPNGDAYNFDLLITNSGGTNVSSYSGITNFSMLTFNVTETTTFSIDEIESSSGCIFTLSPGPSGTITIGVPGAMPNMATLSACDDGSGSALFDLTLADDTVNGSSGETVVWFEDMAGNTAINDPTAYLSSGGTVYAALDIGGCITETAAVTLSIADNPEVTIILDQALSCTGSTDAGITADVIGAGPFSFDWNDNTYDGQQTLTNLSAGFYAVTVTDGNNCEGFADITITDPPALTLDCSVVSDESIPGANDGQASFTVDNGTPQYEALLSGPVNVTVSGLDTDTYLFTDLPPGSYTLTVTDGNGCSADCMFTINPASCDLDLDVVVEQITCNGDDDGSITLTPIGGTAAFDFDWSDDQYDGLSMLTDLPPGNYSVTLTDADGCTAEESIDITEPTPLNLECRANMAGQGSGENSYTFIYSGGTPFYQLVLTGPVNITFTENTAGSWDTAVLPPGPYTFTLTDDNGCSESCSFTIDANCDLSLVLSGTDPSCAGEMTGSLDLVINSSFPIILIDWDDDSLDGQTNPTGLAAGTYTVTVADDLGCVETAGFTLTDPPALSIDCTNTTDPSGVGTSDGEADVIIAGGTAPYTISWSGPVSGSTTAATAGNVLINNLEAGVYTVTLTDDNGCQTTCTFTLGSISCDLNLDLAGTNPDCAGTATGSLDLTIDGSFPITSIDWSEDTFDGTEDPINVPAGLFSVTVTDNQGCVASTSLTLVDPPALFLNCSQTTNPSTNISTDGAVDVIIAGGTPGYTITWSGPVSGSMMSNNAGTFPITGLSIGSYTVVLEDANGCMENCNFVLIEDGTCTFDLTINTIDVSCPGEADGSAFAVPMGGTVPYTYAWSTLENTPVIENLTAQTYTVTVTDANSCVAIRSFTIETSNTTPAITFGMGTDICADSCYLLPLDFVGTAPYTLDYTLESNGMMTNLQATFANDSDSLLLCPNTDGIAIGNFSLTFTNLADANCQASLSETINFNNLTPALGSFAATVCPEDTVIIGGELFDQINPTGTVILPNAAASGCDSTVAVNLDFFPASVFDFSATICPEDTIAVGGMDFYMGNANGQVILDNASSNGCDSTINVDVSFYPDSDFFLNSTICPEDTVFVGTDAYHIDNRSGVTVLDNASTNGCDSTVFVNLFFFPANQVDISGDLCTGDTLMIGGQAFYSGLLSDTIVLDNAGLNGCDSTIFVNLTEIFPATSTRTDDLCAGDTLQIAGVEFTQDFLQDDIVLAGQAANGCDSIIMVDLNLITLTPTPLAATLCPGDSLMVGDSTFTMAGTYQVLLENSSIQGCDSLVQVDLMYYPPAESLVTGTYCAGESVVIGGQTFDIGNSSGTVNLPNASTNGCDSTIVVDLLFLPAALSNLDTLLCFGESLNIGNQTFDAANPNGIVLLTGAAANGCDSTILVNTTYRPELFASIGPDTTLCGTQSVDGILNLSPGTTYDFTIESSSGLQLSGQDVSNELYTFGLGTITEDITLTLLQIESSDGCAVTIEENQAEIRYSDTEVSLASIGGGVGATDLSCADATDGSVQVVVSGGVGPFTYDWNTGSDAVILDNLSAGTYTVTVTDQPGCSVEASITLTAPSPILASVSGASSGCFGSSDGSITIESVSGGTGPYEYSLDGEFFQSVSATETIIPNLAAGAYTVFIQDANDCQLNVAAGVPEATELQLELGDDEVIKLGDSVLIDPQFDFIPAAWTWTPSVGLSQPDTFITYAAPLESTIYQLEMVDENGCLVTDVIRIIVEKDLNVFVPSAFSPDGDGTNDVFMIFAGQGVEEVESFQIFDRWGNQVFFAGPFQPNDPLYGWDGTHNGEVMNAAVFVYFAEVRLITGEVVMLEGEVILLR